MARNKAYDIVAFEGGINTHADARDIEDNQVAMLKNLIATNKGVLRAGYSNSALDTSLYPVLATGGSHGTLNNKNIYVYKTDFNADNENVFTEYLLFTNRRKLYRLEYSNSSWSWEEILDLNFSAGGSLNPGLIVFDGNIRYSDGTFNLNTNSPYLPLNKTLFYGQVRRKYFTATENTVSTITGNASIIKPTDGKIVFNDNIETTENNPTRGFLGLEIDIVQNKVLERNSFGDSAFSSLSLSGSAGTTVPTSNTTKNFIHEHSLVGSVIINADIDKAVDTFGDSQTEVDIAGSDTDLQSFNSQGIQGTQPDVYKIGQSLTDASGYNYIFITEDPKVNGTVWGNEAEFAGNPNRTIKIIGGFFQYNGTNWSSATNWEYNDYSPTIHKVNADGTIGDVIDSSNNNLIVDNNQSDFIQLRFTDTSNCSKYRVRLRAAASEYIEVEKIEIYRSLAGFTDDETDRAFGSVTMQNNYSSFMTRFNNVLDGSLQNPDSVYQIRIAIPDSFEHSALSSINIYFSDATNVEDSTPNYLLYTLGADWISNNQGYGWKTITLKLEDLAVRQNTPVIGSLVDVVLEYNYNENLGNNNTNTDALQIDSLNLVSDESGTWNGYYKFYYTWVYDNNQETGYYEFKEQGNGIYFTNERLSAKALIRELSSGGFGSRGKRITGANIYFKEYDINRAEVKYDDPFLLLELNFEKGAIKPFGTELNAWVAGNNATDHFTHTAIQYIDPSLSSTFSINSGYEYNPLNNIEELRFRTATSLNRRIYYGNVDIVWEKANNETNAKYNRYGDRIYKSLPNKPDIVPAYNFLEVDVNDGDEITALVSYADRLLVFKKEVMYIINATKELEYLEDTHTHKGVISNQSIAEIDFGIAWANLNGCYVYNGEKVIDLSKEKISTSTWGSYVGSSPVITFEPKERHLLISNKDTALGLVYNMNKEAFSLSTSFVTGNKSSNLVFYKNQIIQSAIDTDNDDQVTFKKLDLDYSSSSTLDIHLKTKDFALNEVGAKADIKSIYLTYKATTSESNAIVASYYPNKSTIPVALTNGTLASSPSGYTTVQLIPNPKTGGRSVFSIQLQIASTSAARDIEIHDISIVYKEKSLR